MLRSNSMKKFQWYVWCYLMIFVIDEVWVREIQLQRIKLCGYSLVCRGAAMEWQWSGAAVNMQCNPPYATECAVTATYYFLTIADCFRLKNYTEYVPKVVSLSYACYNAREDWEWWERNYGGVRSCCNIWRITRVSAVTEVYTSNRDLIEWLQIRALSTCSMTVIYI